jgi:hypothetical protein
MRNSFNKSNSVQCGDWYRTWGMGTSLIGKLKKGELEGTYIWRGHSQGRHGQIHCKPYNITFKVTGENEYLREDGDGRLPDSRDVFKAIEQLNKL